MSLVGGLRMSRGIVAPLRRRSISLLRWRGTGVALRGRSSIGSSRRRGTTIWSIWLVIAFVERERERERVSE